MLTSLFYNLHNKKYDLCRGKYYHNTISLTLGSTKANTGYDRLGAKKRHNPGETYIHRGAKHSDMDILNLKPLQKS